MISKKLSRSKTKDLILNSDITQEISKKMRVENPEILLKTERRKKEDASKDRPRAILSRAGKIGACSKRVTLRKIGRLEAGLKWSVLRRWARRKADSRKNLAHPIRGEATLF